MKLLEAPRSPVRIDEAVAVPRENLHPDAEGAASGL